MTIRTRASQVERFREDVERFSRTLQERGDAAADLLGPRAGLEQSPDLLRRALDELRFRHEQLVLAEAELRAQVDALAQAGLRAEAEKQRYVDLFEAAPDPYLVTDLAGIVRDANAEAVELFAIEPRFLHGKPVTGLVTAGGKVSLRESLVALLRSGERVTTVDCFAKPRGREPVACSSRIAVASRGSRLHWIFRRTTAETEARSRAARDAEELLARERTARRLITQSAEAKDRFVAVLAHDLRSSPNAVLSWIEILRRELLDRSARDRAFDAIERSAKVQVQLLDGLVDIAQVASSGAGIDLEPVDLVTIVGMVVEEHGATVTAKGIELRIDTPSWPVRVMGDPRRLAQAASIVVRNALVAAATGDTVAIGLVEGDDSVELVVTDARTDLDVSRVFELPTYHGEAADDTRAVDLWIVKRLVELHLGEVRATSNRAETRFFLSLPLLAAPPRSRAPDAAPLLGVRIVLVVHDDDLRDVFAMVLRRAGAEVRTATETTGALVLLRHGDFDVVVCDLEIPGAHAHVVVQAIRAAFPETSTIALSSFASSADVERTLAAGFDAHLAKHTSPTEIVETVRGVVPLRSS